MENTFVKKNGFTIIELIIAGAISITAIGVGFSVLQVAIKGNKIDETQMGINGRINDTLDFILDEVKSSKRIIDKEVDVTKFNSNCALPTDGEFLFGISLPNQALGKSDYEPKGDIFNLDEVECPIVYSIRESLVGEKTPYVLVRYGPQYNELGYYVSPSYQQFQETVLLDGITSSAKYKKISCPSGWEDLKTIRGVSFCVDRFKKAIELQIEAGDPQQGIYSNDLRSLASVGGFSSIQDESLINIAARNAINFNDSPSCTGGQCCWMGICLKSNKVTYLIDNSFYMNEDYLHYNGQIIAGNWQSINDPALVSPRINGKSLFDYVITSLKQHINQLPTSNESENANKMYIQIIANNGNSNYLFENGPQELTAENKVTALNHLNNLRAEAVSSINPWNDICTALESEYIGQLIILSAWFPSTNSTSSQQPCAGTTEGDFADIVAEYNQFTRSKSVTGALLIDSISLFNNYCESSKNYFRNNWLGAISEGAESYCIHIK